MKNAESLLLTALRRGMRVTRKTSLDRGWCENLTATISRLRKKGYTIVALRAMSPTGAYTRYKLLSEPDANHLGTAKAA
jgi:hypothetical protein